MGIVSGVDTIDTISAFHITAPINPGSSGGPIINVHGQVVGITFGAIPLAQNVGYGLPVNEISLILDELSTKPLVRKSHVGARLVPASDEMATYLGNPVPAGMYIGKVFKDMLFIRRACKRETCCIRFKENYRRDTAK